MLGKATKKQLRKPGELETALRRMIHAQGKADSTADCYWEWVEKFLKWVYSQRKQWVHPKDMGRAEVERYLSWLANDRRVSSTTQNQAFSALCFLYRWVVKQPIENCSQRVSAFRSSGSSRMNEPAASLMYQHLYAFLQNGFLMVRDVTSIVGKTRRFSPPICRSLVLFWCYGFGHLPPSRDNLHHVGSG